jgi:hypothetical protein
MRFDDREQNLKRLEGPLLLTKRDREILDPLDECP